MKIIKAEDNNIVSMLVKKDYIHKIVENREYNRLIEYYYQRLAEEKVLNEKLNEFKEIKEDISYVYRDFIKKEYFKSDKDYKAYLAIKSKSERMNDCNEKWNIDKYENAKVKEFKKTYLCKDMFCANCKKVKQANRMKRYLDKFAEKDKDLYFLTLTIPSVGAVKLRDKTINMNDAYGTLMDLLKGRKKIKGIDFEHFGYEGSVRSTEVSFKVEGRDRFHPHNHCAVVFKNYVPGSAYIKNRYSIDHTGRREDRLFTRDEVLIQKLWFIIINGAELCKENLDYCSVIKQGHKVTIRNTGYSCTIDKFKPGQYKEMMKYIIKDKDMDGRLMDYETFKALYYALHDIRQIQGYGCFYGLEKEDDPFQEEVNEVYKEVMNLIRKKGLPVMVLETPEEAEKDSEYIYISRKKINSYLRICLLEETFDNDSYFIKKEEKIQVKSVKFYEDLIDYLFNVKCS